MNMGGIKIPIVSTFDPKGMSAGQKRLAAFGRVANGILLGVAGAAVTATLAAEKVASANARVGNVFKSMGYPEATDRALEYADALESQIGVDEVIIKNTQAKLATFKELTKTADEAGGAFDRATMAALDMAATGFGSAESNAVQLGKALNDPVKGITALTRSGITFTEKEKEKIKTLVESGNILKAQDKILKAIEMQVGGTAAATADDSAKMKLGFQEILETLGEGLLPILKEIIPYVQKMAKWIAENTDTVKKIVAALLIFAGTIKAVQAAVAIYNTVQKVMEWNAKRAAAGQWMLNASLLANPVVLIVAAVVALIAALVYFYKTNDTVREKVDAAWEAIKGVIMGLWNWISENFPKIFNILITPFKLWWTAVSTIWGKIFDFFKTFGPTLVEKLSKVKDILIAPFKTAFNAIATLWNNTLGKFKFKLPDWLPAIGGKEWGFPKIPMLAKGGIVTKPTLAMIGEAGAEAVIPLNRKNAMGGINITVNGALDPEGVARQIQTILRRSELRAGAY